MSHRAAGLGGTDLRQLQGRGTTHFHYWRKESEYPT